MTTTERIHEITSRMTSFPEPQIHRSALLAELLKLQAELCNETFNDIHAENSKLRLWDVQAHLEKLNEERGHVADVELRTFKKGCKIVSGAISSEIIGSAGEYKAARCLDIIRCNKRILRNIEFSADDRRTELDFIVFTEKAIFILEVKNPQKDIYIDERGNYCRAGNATNFDKNIGESMNNKAYLLRQALINAGYEEPNIQSVVVFTNNNIHVENRFPHIDITYLSALPHIIEKYEGDSLYTITDIERMANSVQAAACKEAYPLPFDVNQFKTDFATLMAKLEDYDYGEEKDINRYSKFPPKKKSRVTPLNVIATVGIFVSLTAAIASIVHKKVKRC